MGLDFDLQAFRRYLTVQRLLRPATVTETIQKLTQAQREGLRASGLMNGIADAKDHAETYLARFAETHSVHSYNMHVKMINHVLGFAGHDVLRFRKQQEPKSFPKYLSAHEVYAVASYRHPKQSVSLLRRALVGFNLATGMRRGELHRANVSDLDPDNYRVHIRRPSKRGVERWIPVPTWLFHPRRPFMAYLRSRPQPKVDTDALFVVERGGTPRRPDLNYMGRLYGDITEAVGFTVNPTRLRHTLATSLQAHGGRIETIQLILGHSSVAVTQGYARMDPDTAEAQLARLYGRRKLKAVRWRKWNVRDPWRPPSKASPTEGA